MSQTVNVSSGRHNEESTLSRLNQIKYSDPCCKSCLFWLHFMSVKKLFHDYLCILCILYEGSNLLKHTITITIILQWTLVGKHFYIYIFYGTSVSIISATLPWSTVLSAGGLSPLYWITAPPPGVPQPLQELLWYLWRQQLFSYTWQISKSLDMFKWGSVFWIIPDKPPLQKKPPNNNKHVAEKPGGNTKYRHRHRL